MDIDQEDASVNLGIENIFSALSLNNLIIESEVLRDSINKVCSGNQNEEQIGLIAIRKFLSVDVRPPIQDVINTRIVPVLIRMSYDRPYEFAFEVCWILCNIGSGTTQHTKYLIDIGALDFFNDVFEYNTNSYKIKEQIVWAVGNIAGDCVEFRNLIQNSKILQKILDFSLEMLEMKQLKIIENCVWALSNCVRGKPIPGKKIYDLTYGIFLKALLLINDENTDIIWSLSYITEFSSISNVFENTHLTKIVSLLDSSNIATIIPSLRIFGNISARVAESCKILLPLGVLEKILRLIRHEKKIVRRESFWTLSNMCSENNDVVCILLSTGGYQSILDEFDNQDNEVSGEIIWTISNSFLSADQFNIIKLFEIGWCHKFIELMKGQRVAKHKETVVEGLIMIFNKCPNLLTYELKQEILNIREYSEGNISLSNKIEKLIKNIEACKINQNYS